MNAKTIRLVSGNDREDGGVCLEQLVALLAGEARPHDPSITDEPRCACPVIAQWGIIVNDNASDEERGDLYEFAVRQIGTRDDGLMHDRLFAMSDWALRELLPLCLDEYVGSEPEASTMRNLAPITTLETAERGVGAALDIWSHDNVPASSAETVEVALEILRGTQPYWGRSVDGTWWPADAKRAIREAVSLFADLSDIVATVVNDRDPEAVRRMRVELLDRICPPWPSVDELECLRWDRCEAVPGIEPARELAVARGGTE